MPDGSGLIKQHLGDTVKVYAVGSSEDVRKLYNNDIENRWWKLALIEAKSTESSDYNVSDATFFAAKKTKKFRDDKLIDLLDKHGLKFRSVDITHNYRDHIISPYLMRQSE